MENNSFHNKEQQMFSSVQIIEISIHVNCEEATQEEGNLTEIIIIIIIIIFFIKPLAVKIPRVKNKR